MLWEAIFQTKCYCHPKIKTCPPKFLGWLRHCSLCWDFFLLEGHQCKLHTKLCSHLLKRKFRIHKGSGVSRKFSWVGSFSGIWWSFVFGVRYLWRHNLTSYSCIGVRAGKFWGCEGFLRNFANFWGKNVCTLILISMHIKRFCKGFHTFYPNFHRICPDFKGFSPNQNFLGVSLHPLHCTPPPTPLYSKPTFWQSLLT